MSITPEEAIKLLRLATKPRVTKEIELSVALDVTDKFLEAVDMAISALKKQTLPSAQPEVLACGEGVLNAQPEIVRCKDCKFYSPMNKETKTGICSLTMHQNFGDNWFCAGAERRTDE